MSRAWHPGQLLFVGWTGTRPTAKLLEWVANGSVGGVVLFRRNVESPTQVKETIAALREAAPVEAPLVVAMDQEGGRVQRLREPWTRWPAMRMVGDRNDLAVTKAVARAISLELADVGVNLNFAPVVDVATRSDNPVIGDRSFGETAARVSAHALAFLQEASAQGIASCAKHFPGHGDTDVDSHLALPRLLHDRKRLDAVELAPFRELVAAGVPAIMTAHVLFELLDRKRPATLSPACLSILRDEMQYQGLVIVDDLEMKAVASHYSVSERVLGPLAAGADVALICESLDFQEEALALLSRQRDSVLEAALTRMVEFKRKWAKHPSPTPSFVADPQEVARLLEELHAGAQPKPKGPPYPEHLSLAAKLARGASVEEIFDPTEKS